jgi:dienelactone hydrolase
MNEASSMRFEYSVDGQRRYLGTLYPSPAAAPVAAIVLLPDWRGQGALARDHADYLTSLGCTVVVADLYGDGFNPDRPEQVGPMVKRLLENRADGVKALAACVTRLREDVAPGTPVICLGYSAGGMIALDYARSGAGIAGVVLCSALLKTAAPGSDTRIAAPVLILQGTQDQVSPMETIDAVIAEMDAAGNDARFELFSQTHHAFDNPDAGTDPTARLVYSARSARRARQAIAHFVAEVAGKTKDD